MEIALTKAGEASLSAFIRDFGRDTLNFEVVRADMLEALADAIASGQTPTVALAADETRLGRPADFMLGKKEFVFVSATADELVSALDDLLTAIAHADQHPGFASAGNYRRAIDRARNVLAAAEASVE